MHHGEPSGEWDDAQLWRAHLAGDQDAFPLLVARHQQRLWAGVRRVLRNRQDAEDAMQTGLLHALNAADQVHEPAAVAGWLYRIVTNAAVDIAVQSRSRGTDPLDEHTNLTPAAQDPALELSVAVQEAVLGLPPNHQAAYFLKVLREFTLHESAELLGVPVNTVASWAFRGRQQTMARLGEPEPPEPPDLPYPPDPPSRA